MDLNYTREDETFRQQVRQFIDASLPADIRAVVKSGKPYERHHIMRWQEILHRKGWGAPSWPVEFGGTGWTPVQQHIFDEECAAADAPIQLPFGLRMVAPVIMTFGNGEQQKYFLPRILSGEHWWCQGYSEPSSGSDLASLKTRAERRGDHYVVNGQKTWTTYAQHADWIFCLVRTATEGRPQEGISFLLIDMKSAGVTVRPIQTLDGEHEINEVWLENVKVPVENRVGEENKGWTYAKFLLGHERTGIAGVGRSKAALQRLKAIARRETANGRALIEDPRFRDKVAHVELELMALEITHLRVISSECEKQGPGPEVSILKIKGSEIQQALSELWMQALGHQVLPRDPGTLGVDQAVPPNATFSTAATRYFNLRKTTIFSGSNEIQRNLIAQHILRL